MIAKDPETGRFIGLPWAEKSCEQCEVVFQYRATRGNRRFCSKHCWAKGMSRLKLNNVRTGPDSALWRGGHVTKNGYRLMGIAGRRVFEHRYVMEQCIGRRLLERENVHHLNGDRLDNRIENLEIWVTRQPQGARAGEVHHCQTCTCAIPE